MAHLRAPALPTFVELPPRRAILAAVTDVLVVGGGPAGLGAALGAAAAGARVILAERYGFLGGNATAALVMPLMSFHTNPGPPPGLGPERLVPHDHGEGVPVIGGALGQLVERLVRWGGALRPSVSTGFVVPFDPETFKLVALELLEEAGVELLLHAFASGVAGPDRRREVVFETKDGPVVIRARAVVDATGDGDIAADAGAPFEVGRELDGLVQPMTLMFRMVGFRREAFADYARAHPDQWRGVHGLWELVQRATDAGELELTRDDVLLFDTPHPDELSVNVTRVQRVLGTNPWDLTCAELESRRQMRQVVAFLRKWVPGFEESYLVQSGVQVGVRETRRIIGEYHLEAADLLEAREFPDVIARGTYPLDIHDPKGKGTRLQHLPPGLAYGIPLRALIPQRVDGLVVAGRCISGTHAAHSSYRVMPVSMATGQAAGVCAALSAHKRRPPRDIKAADVQNELRRQGADLGP